MNSWDARQFELWLAREYVKAFNRHKEQGTSGSYQFRWALFEVVRRWQQMPGSDIQSMVWHRIPDLQKGRESE